MYAHISALSVLPDPYKSTTEGAIKLNSDFGDWNVVKLNLKDAGKLSFLKYDNFDTTEFPCLHHSCQIDLQMGFHKIRKHSSRNPPVLHSEPTPLKWSDPIVRKTEDQRWPLRDPSLKRLS